MWKRCGCFVEFITHFTLVWSSVFTHVSAEFPIMIRNLSFLMEPFGAKNDLTIGATVVTDGLQTMMNDSTFSLNYTLSRCKRPGGLQLCSLRFGDQLRKTGHAFLQCTLTDFKVCQDKLYICLIEAFIIGRNKTDIFTKSDVMIRDVFYSVPLLPVRRLRSSKISSSSVKLSWDKPDCVKMPYDYVIESYRNGTLDKHFWENGKAGQRIDVDINGLNPYTDYKFCVSAKPNILIEGLSSKECILSKTKEGVPMAVPIIEHVKPIVSGKDMGKAVVFWRVASLDKLNGKLRKFVISYTMKRDLNIWRDISVPATAGIGLMNHTLTNLFIDQEYALKVYLVTGGGTKPSQVRNFHFLMENPTTREVNNVMEVPIVAAIVVPAVILLIIPVFVTVWHIRKRNTAEPHTRLIGERKEALDPRNHAYERSGFLASQEALNPRNHPYEIPEIHPVQESIYETIEDNPGSQSQGNPDIEIQKSHPAHLANGGDACDPLSEEPSEDVRPCDCELATLGSEFHPLGTEYHFEEPMISSVS